jgi:hypothetical protein
VCSERCKPSFYCTLLLILNIYRHASDRDTILSAYIEYAPWLKEKLVIAIDDKELMHCLESMVSTLSVTPLRHMF